MRANPEGMFRAHLKDETRHKAGFRVLREAPDQFWTFSSVRRFFSLLQAGKVVGVGSIGRVKP